jgi:DNA-binding transcriptional LysR family regulator
MEARLESTDRMSRRLKLQDFRVLEAVVRCGSMAKAATQLNVTQPAVSKAIGELERTLGVRLLERNPHGVEPTVYGRALLKRSVAIFDEIRQGVKEIEFLADPTAGEVRIGCQEPIAAALVPTIVERLGRQYPGITCHVVQTTTTDTNFRELRERSVDLMLTRIPASFVDEDLHAEVLFQEQIYVVAGKKNKWARRRNIELTELISETWLLTPPNTVPFLLVEEAFRARGLKVPVARAVSLSVHLHASLLATGRYLAVLPGSFLRYSPMRSAFKALPVDFPAKPRPIAIVTLQHRTPNPVAKIVIDCARDVAKPLA